MPRLAARDAGDAKGAIGGVTRVKPGVRAAREVKSADCEDWRGILVEPVTIFETTVSSEDATTGDGICADGEMAIGTRSDSDDCADIPGNAFVGTDASVTEANIKFDEKMSFIVDRLGTLGRCRRAADNWDTAQVKS